MTPEDLATFKDTTRQLSMDCYVLISQYVMMIYFGPTAHEDALDKKTRSDVIRRATLMMWSDNASP